MFKKLWNKWRYSRQKDNIDILLMYIVSSGKIGVELPFEDNKGKVVKMPVVGYNDKRVYIDVNHQLAYFTKDRIRLTDDELYSLIDSIEPALVPPKPDKFYKHLQNFKALEGKAVRLRHTITGQIHKYEKLCLDCTEMMQSESPVYHLPILISFGWISKVMYLEDLEITPNV